MVEHPGVCLQQEIMEAELKSLEQPTHASVAHTPTTIPEGNLNLDETAIKSKRMNTKVVINGVGQNPGLKAVGKMPKRKAIFISPLGPDTTVKDIVDFLAPSNLKDLVCHKLETKDKTYASFCIEIYENDLGILLDASFWPEDCQIFVVDGKLRND